MHKYGRRAPESRFACDLNRHLHQYSNKMQLKSVCLLAVAALSHGASASHGVDAFRKAERAVANHRSERGSPVSQPMIEPRQAPSEYLNNMTQSTQHPWCLAFARRTIILTFSRVRCERRRDPASGLRHRRELCWASPNFFCSQ